MRVHSPLLLLYLYQHQPPPQALGVLQDLEKVLPLEGPVFRDVGAMDRIRVGRRAEARPQRVGRDLASHFHHIGPTQLPEPCHDLRLGFAATATATTATSGTRSDLESDDPAARELVECAAVLRGVQDPAIDVEELVGRLPVEGEHVRRGDSEAGGLDGLDHRPCEAGLDCRGLYEAERARQRALRVRGGGEGLTLARPEEEVQAPAGAFGSAARVRRPAPRRARDSILPPPHGTLPNDLQCRHHFAEPGFRLGQVRQLRGQVEAWAASTHPQPSDDEAGLVRLLQRRAEARGVSQDGHCRLARPIKALPRVRVRVGCDVELPAVNSHRRSNEEVR